jgi:hypothetical protein
MPHASLANLIVDIVIDQLRQAISLTDALCGYGSVGCRMWVGREGADGSRLERRETRQRSNLGQRSAFGKGGVGIVEWLDCGGDEKKSRLFSAPTFAASSPPNKIASTEFLTTTVPELPNLPKHCLCRFAPPTRRPAMSQPP